MNGHQISIELEKLKSDGADFSDLLAAAVRLLHESNDKFHWTGIYELYSKDVLRVGPFIGAPTDHVFIAVGRGVCGSAVADGRNKNIPDVTKEPNYLACSSATRSELVILIQRNDKIYAQIDIDSHEVDAFDETAVRTVQLVADWLALAYETRMVAEKLGRRR